MKTRVGTAFLTCLAVIATSAPAQILKRGSAPPAKRLQQRPDNTTNALTVDGDGPTTNALPGCGEESGEPIYNFDAPPPPERKKLGASPGGVDMRAGQLSFQNTEVSVGGEGDAGLSLTRSFAYRSPNAPFRQAFGEFFTHNWDIQVNERRTPRAGACYPSQFNYTDSVIFGDLSDTFRKQYSAQYFERTSQAGYSTLTATYSSGGTPDNLVFTARDGTVVTFLPFGSCGAPLERCAYAASAKRSDGTLYTFEYDIPANGAGRLLRSVVSNRGFALLFEYGASVSSPTKICALNLAIVLKPSNNICPSGARFATYSYSGSQLSATDMSGGVWAFAKPTATSFTLTRPGEMSPYSTNNYSYVQGSNDTEPSLVIDSQQLADGRTFSYGWNVLWNGDASNGYNQQVMGGTWTDGQGRSLNASFGYYYPYWPTGAYYPTYYPTPGPETITDELGRVTKFVYCPSVPQGGNCGIPPAQSSEDPGGIKELYSYDATKNLIQTVTKAKPSSGLPDITVSSMFICAPTNACNKPSSKTDGRGQTTSYTYNSTTGQTLTETSPADANGVQPVKRYAYMQRQAWVSNGSGFVQNSNPVSLLEQERTCRTTATTSLSGSSVGCAGGSADEVVTTYDYGPNTGAVGNNLLLRGIAVTADGATRRTCYGYDAQGNRIWETKPRAGLSACY